MEKSISFSDIAKEPEGLLSSLRQGESIVLTEEGKPVARITPIVTGPKIKDDRKYAKFLKELGKGPAANAGKWTRNELYDD